MLHSTCTTLFRTIYALFPVTQCFRDFLSRIPPDQHHSYSIAVASQITTDRFLVICFVIGKATPLRLKNTLVLPPRQPCVAGHVAHQTKPCVKTILTFLNANMHPPSLLGSATVPLCDRHLFVGALSQFSAEYSTTNYPE